MTKYVLDMSDVDPLPWWWPDDAPKLIPVTPGKHSKEWDLVMDELPDSFRALLISIGLNTYPGVVTDLPIGFNAKDLWGAAKGAKIKEIESD